MIVRSQKLPNSCSGCSDSMSMRCASAVVTAAATSCGAARTSASMKQSQSHSVDNAPRQHACDLPIQPLGNVPAGTALTLESRALHRSTAAVVPSCDSSSTTMIDQWPKSPVCARSVSRHGPMFAISFLAGTMIETEGDRDRAAGAGRAA